MKKAVIIFSLMLASLPVFAKPADPASLFIKAQRQAFQDSYGHREDKGLLREFGHGTGIYSNIDKDVTVRNFFEWYAYCGPDGFVMFQFNILISYKDRYEIMLKTDETSDRPWDAEGEGGETRLNLDSRWIGCALKQDCNYHKVLDDYLAKFMKFPFFTEMKVATYF